MLLTVFDFELALKEPMNAINKIVIEFYDNPFKIIIFGKVGGGNGPETHEKKLIQSG